MDADRQLAETFKAINVWKRGGERAPHKPLLLLLALGRVQRGEARLVPFADVEGPLRGLLQRYGPTRRSYHPDNPFWYMRSDGLWEIPGGDALPKVANRKRPVLGALRKASGGLPEEIFRRLRQRPELLREVAQRILDEHFPSSYHEDLLAEVGLSLERAATEKTRSRDPLFRPRVLNAYGYRCAVCGLDANLDGATIGLEAAHVRWHSHGGPDEVSNGLALCPLHHKAFDVGAIGLVEDRTVAVSSRLHGGESVDDLLGQYHGRALHGPVHGAESVWSAQLLPSAELHPSLWNLRVGVVGVS